MKTIVTNQTHSATPVYTEQDFLRNTYVHMLGAVVTFIGLEVLLFKSGIALALAPIMTSNWLIVLGGFMLLGWITGYFAGRNASIGAQYIQMAVTVVLQTLIFIPLLAYAVYFSDPSVLSSSVMVTLVIFGTMTAVVAYTNTNFSFMGPFLAIIGVAALLAIVGSVLFSVSLGFYFAVGMAVFGAAVVLYETSKIKHDYRPNQHIAAGTALFASVALLFYYVLMVFASRD